MKKGAEESNVSQYLSSNEPINRLILCEFIDKI